MFPAKTLGKKSQSLTLRNAQENSNQDADDAREDRDPSEDLCHDAAVVLSNPVDHSCQKQAADTTEDPPPPGQQIKEIHNEEDYTPFFW